MLEVTKIIDEVISRIKSKIDLKGVNYTDTKVILTLEIVRLEIMGKKKVTDYSLRALKEISSMSHHNYKVEFTDIYLLVQKLMRAIVNYNPNVYSVDLEILGFEHKKWRSYFSDSINNLLDSLDYYTDNTEIKYDEVSTNLEKENFNRVENSYLTFKQGELEVLHSFWINKKNRTCDLCNTHIKEGTNKCSKCSGEYREKIKPKCFIDKKRRTSIKEIKEFVKISDEHFFEFENYNTIVLGGDTIFELIKMLEKTIDDSLDYRIFLALRMCGVEIWGSLDEKIKYKYRLPEENVFKEISEPIPSFKLKLQNNLNNTENLFTININDFPSNIYIVNNEQYDNNSRFFDGIWIFILFKEEDGITIRKIHEVREITEEYPNFNFALKSFKNNREMQEFITIDIDNKTSPIILYRREFESHVLANGVNSKEHLKELLDKIIEIDNIS